MNQSKHKGWLLGGKHLFLAGHGSMWEPRAFTGPSAQGTRGPGQPAYWLMHPSASLQAWRQHNPCKKYKTEKKIAKSGNPTHDHIFCQKIGSGCKNGDRTPNHSLEQTTLYQQR